LDVAVRENRGVRRGDGNGKKYRGDSRAALGEHAEAAGNKEQEQEGSPAHE
jgi:hypothetical protein